jgi:CBS domain-containing membrane protein
MSLMVNVKQFFRFITVDPVNLSFKGKLLSVSSCFIAILVVAWVTHKFSDSVAYPILVASMGASAVILFIIPHSPLTQPWPLVGGQLVSALVGIWSTQVINDTALASACAVGISVLVMFFFKMFASPRRGNSAYTHYGRRSDRVTRLWFCVDAGRLKYSHYADYGDCH